MNEADRNRTIFDERLQRMRISRAVARPDYPGFLHDLATTELLGRLDTITRTFARTVVMIDRPGGFAKDLQANPRFGNVTVVSQTTCGDVQASHEMPPLRNQSIDCLVSVLALHAVNDLPGALVQYRRALRPDGLFIACLLGEGSLDELRQSWLTAEAETTGGATPRVAPFAGTRELGALLQRAGFALPVVDCDRFTLTYPSALAAMREVKALGWSNSLAARARIPVTRPLLASAASHYETRFAGPDNRVPLSLTFAYLTAWSPHESQQKPLKPGSAKTRLADALKVTEYSSKHTRDET